MSMKTYLAGPIQHVDDNGAGWRSALESEYEDEDWIEFLNPLDKYNSATDAEYVPRDRWDEYDSLQDRVGENFIVEEDKKLIDEADAIFVGWIEAPACGTPMEVMYQYIQNQISGEYTPIVVWWRDSEESDGFISPWMEYHADFICEDREEAMTVLRGQRIGMSVSDADSPLVEEKVESLVQAHDATKGTDRNF